MRSPPAEIATSLHPSSSSTHWLPIQAPSKPNANPSHPSHLHDTGIPSNLTIPFQTSSSPTSIPSCKHLNVQRERCLKKAPCASASIPKRAKKAPSHPHESPWPCLVATNLLSITSHAQLTSNHILFMFHQLKLNDKLIQLSSKNLRRKVDTGAKSCWLFNFIAMHDSSMNNPGIFFLAHPTHWCARFCDLYCCLFKIFSDRTQKLVFLAR